MVKFWLYSSASLVACAGLLWYTYMTRQQFYPAVIYLVTSKISVLVLGNAALVLMMLFGRLMKSIFLGTLRDAEVEIMHENVRYAVTETCLALTIFRDEINFQVVVLFSSLIFLKIFHWLSQSRIEFIEQTDVITRLTHMRLVALMSVLAAVDTIFVVICGMKVMETGPSVFILFGFEVHDNQLMMITTNVWHFVVFDSLDHTDRHLLALFYLELISEIIKLVVYLVFFLLIFTYYGMPLHIIRDLWVSIKSLQRRIASYFRYRKITANLNERFPNPTEQELQETDRTCIICREEMTPAACKKLPCSHIFHIDCLKLWVQRQQTCPTCRSAIPTGGRPQPPAPSPEAPAAPAPPQAPQPPVAGFGQAPIPPAAPAPHQSGATAAATPAHAPTAATPSTAAHAPPAHTMPHNVHPVMASPFMPFGFPFAMMPPGFGMPFGHHPHSTPHPSSTHMDPAHIQQQIDHLHAQLLALQSMSQQFGMGFHGMSMPMPPVPPAAPPTSSQQPHTPSNPPQPATPAATQALTSSQSSPNGVLEEKAPAPTATPSSSSASGTKDDASIDAPIPATLSEAERRREELRRRYARIYGSNNASAASSEQPSDESSKKDQ